MVKSMSDFIYWFQHISSNSWQNFWSVIGALIGSVATIYGVILTFRYQREKDKQDRIDKIKPVIFVRLTNNDSNVQDETNGVFQFFQGLEMFTDNQKTEKRSLEFSLYVQGDYPAKNIKFKGFEITEENNNTLNLGKEIKARSVFETKEDSKKLWNFAPLKTNVDWKREQLTVFKNESRKMEILLLYKKAQLEQFQQKYWKLPFDITNKLFSELVPVIARFSYEDIDGNEYEDLSVEFFTGLTLKNELVEPVITQKAPFKDNPLVNKFVEYQTNQSMKEVRNHGQN